MKNAKLEIYPITPEGELDEENVIVDTFNENYEITLTPGNYQFLISKKDYKGSDMTITCKPGNQSETLPPCIKLAQTTSQRPKSRVPTGGANSQGYDTQLKSQGSQEPQNKSQQQVQFSNNTNNSNNQAQQRPGSAKKDQRPISAKSLNVYVYNALDNQPIQGVRVKIFEKKLKREDQVYLSDDKGNCVIPLNNVLQGVLEIEHPKYMKIVEDYAPNKMDLTKSKDMSFPLILKPERDDELHIRVLTNIGKNLLKLFVIQPDNSTTSDSIQGKIDIQNDMMNGHGQVCIRNLKAHSGLYRIYAEVLE